jgi:hypothetical protein
MLWKMNKRISAIGMADLITGESLYRSLELYLLRPTHSHPEQLRLAA